MPTFRLGSTAKQSCALHADKTVSTMLSAKALARKAFCLMFRACPKNPLLIIAMKKLSAFPRQTGGCPLYPLATRLILASNKKPAIITVKLKGRFIPMKKIATVAVVTALTLGGCTANGQGPTGQGMGGFLGGIAGGVIGNQFGEGGGKTAATIGGALLGMWVGSNLGAHLTEGDRRYHDNATRTAYEVPNGETVQWDNPQTGHMGTVTPTRTGRTNSGAYCREFQQTITIDGATERAYGTACQQPDGSWQIIS